MIGEIIREDGQILLEMAKIGEFEGFSIYIYGSEGPKPHFHLIRDPDFESCIEIKNALYFNHSGKESTLNSKEKSKMVSFFKKQHHLLKGTNWEVLVIQWCMSNPEYEIDTKTKMPNYLEL